MRGFLFTIILVLFILLQLVRGQSNQTVTNGSTTSAVNFNGAGCSYSWTNSDPAIGLPAVGTGNIPSFTAVNNGSSPVVAKITATPVNSGFAYIFSTIGQLAVINTTTDQVISTSPFPFNPFGETISPDGKFIYLADPGNNDVLTVDAATLQVVNALYTGPNSSPRGIAISPDGSTLYVTNEGSFPSPGSVAVINTATHAVKATVTVGQSPLGIVVSPDGSKIYVSNQASGVSVIDAATNNVLSTLPVDGSSALTLNHSGTLLYVTTGGNTISVINTATNAVLSTIAVGQNAHAVKVSQDDKTVYVVNGDSQTVSVIDAQSRTVIATVNLTDASQPCSISLSADGKKAYVINQNGVVNVINTATNQLTTSVNTVIGAFSFGDFTSAGPGCNSSPVSFTITVNPTSASPVITAGTLTGTISACVGTASVLPNSGQFTISGSNLSSAVTATAPVGFEVSITPGNGYGNSVTLDQSAGNLSSTTIYVRSAASDAAGQLSGDVVLSSSGAVNQNVAVSGVVNALPTVNIVPNQTVNNGASTTVVNFTGTGSTFTWTNDTPGIGLAAYGTGNISSFTAVNTGGTPVTAYITVTPKPAGFAYITNLNDNTVSVINTTTYEIVSTILVGKQPEGVAISKDGQTVYVTNYGSNSISVISASSNTVTSTINVGQSPYQVILSPDDSKLYVSNPNGNTISEINIATGIVINTFAVGANPNGIRLSADGTYLYALSALTSDLYVINTATNALIANIQVGTVPSDLVISPDGTRAYVISAGSTDITVINTVNNTLIKTIHVGTNLQAICTSPDGSKIYISDIGTNEILVYDTATYNLITSIHVGNQPEGISLTPDGSWLFAANQTSNTVSIIDTQNNTLINTIAVGNAPASIGKFISAGTGCVGTPTTFSITVNPSFTSSITASTATGSIIGCEGLVSPNIQQFTVSGSGLTANITATAPSDFEISFNATIGYSSSLTLTQTNGIVSNTIIYVRSSATAAAGSISGDVSLTSTGAISQSVIVRGFIYAIPTVNAVVSQTLTSGTATFPVNFSGTATTYNWVNNTPGIGMPASGTGDIPSFTAINIGQAPVIATITVTPGSAGGCSGSPIVFTIRVEAGSPATLTAEGSFAGFSTTYGTPSHSSSFTISGTNTSTSILITPPAGYEISADNTNFTNTLTVGAAGQVRSTTAYIRLAAVTPVGNFTGSIVLRSGNTSNSSLIISSGVVLPADLIISADDQTKSYGADNPVLTISYTGFQNNDGPAQLIQPPQISTNALTNSPIGRYDILIGGAAAANYAITYRPGVLVILPVGKLLIPNAFTPNGDGINDTWNIQNIDQFPNCTVHIYDRWGTSVYSSIGYGTPWNGNYKGKPLPFSAYYYVIDLKNDKQPLSGYVTIVR